MFDIYHINNVSYLYGRLFISGTELPYLYFIKNNQLFCYTTLPLGTHNAHPFKKGVIYNDTSSNRIIYKNLNGKIIELFKIKEYPENELLYTNLPKDYVRQAFGRGLCKTSNGLIIGGSSPALISVYKSRSTKAVKNVNISMDIRNSIHGLAIWPY